MGSRHYCRDNPKMVGYGGLRDCYYSLGFSRLTHPTLFLAETVHYSLFPKALALGY
jgi:hypothetical protein